MGRFHDCIPEVNKSTAHGCWTLDFFVSDIKLQAIYKVIHTSNYDGHSSCYVTITVFDIKGEIKSLNSFYFHPILMHFFAK
jgi:hypothetical protein